MGMVIGFHRDGRNRCAMGMRRPMPNARGDTFSPGAAWRRLYSLNVTLLITSLTTAASKSLLDDFLLAQIFHDVGVQIWSSVS